ncbi:MAG: putative metal-binding motif-containing protein, partial [Myxococcota bacterium]
MPVSTCDGPPANHVDNPDDCDDMDPNNFIGNPEVCDGSDNDCDTLVDNGLTFVTYYPDNDADSFGSANVSGTSTCDGPPIGWVTDNSDCDDGTATVNPNGIEVVADAIDQDCDGFDDCYADGDLDGVGIPTVIPGTTLTCSGSGESSQFDDCDDTDPNNFPGNVELCDGSDNNCDTFVDETLVFVDYFPDNDGDGYGDGSAMPINSCGAAPMGYVSNGGDCDDLVAAINPGATEAVCNGIDDDCSPATPDARDQDGDGVDECLDCNDADPANYPGNLEVCDGADNDCDSVIDNGVPFVDYWPDGDGDGWGNPLATAVQTCDGPPLGTVDNDLDCDDADALLNQDDLDTDTLSTCDGDCNDGDATIFPGAVDLPDALFVDQDCDGIDGSAANAVFVSTSGTDLNNNVCDQVLPCRTLTRAQAVATLLGLSEVYVQAGTYSTETVLIDTPVAVYGGYDATWQRDDSNLFDHQARFNGGYVASEDEYIAFRIRNVVAELHDLRIVGPNSAGAEGGNGKSSYAIHTLNADLTAVRLRIDQGRGEDGFLGSSGSSASQIPASSATGGAGGGGSGWGVCNTSRPARGVGGTNTCDGAPRPGAPGGRGGSADTLCCSFLGTPACGSVACATTSSDCTARAGLQGNDALNATGIYGQGGNGGVINGAQGQPGSDGRVFDGAGGAGSGNRGRLIGNYWYGVNGNTGGAGGPGTGGGGGGGGGGSSSPNWSGGGGGGGGAGGCGADGGSGGGAGGSSFGIFA